jgi:hypothetical protein
MSSEPLSNPAAPVYSQSIFLGAQRFGTGRQKTKNCLVFERQQYRYQKFMSDIAGPDIAAHTRDPATLITTIRDWLSTVARPNKQPGAKRALQI